MSDDIHKDSFHIPESTKEIPRGKIVRINGKRYIWTGKKYRPLPEKREKRGRKPEDDE